jgi:hypothetical protein
MFLTCLFVSGCLKNDIVVDDKLVIINVEHGLVDQLDFFVVGERIKKMGYKVKYDISWFSRYGFSNRGGTSKSIFRKLKFTFDIWIASLGIKRKSVSSRTFQLLQAFPYIECDIATEKELEFYKNKNFFIVSDRYYNESWSFGKEVIPPVRIIVQNIEYWRRCQDAVGYMLRAGDELTIQKECYEYFHFEDSILDDKNLAILEKIRSEKCPIGIHVRRGDDAMRGEASPSQYFVKAVKRVKEMFPESSFFFVSDEPDFVKEEILPKLDKEIKVELVDINDVDAAYKDLFLLSECKHQIRSQGSMGAIAYLINRHNDKKLIAPKSVRAFSNITPSVVIE